MAPEYQGEELRISTGLDCLLYNTIALDVAVRADTRFTSANVQ